MGAGLLYAAIIVGWAAYLIPHALRRYDEASRSRSIDRFSSAMRVLGRKPSSDAVSTVKPSGPAERPQPAPQPGAPHAAERAAARAAARRRRHVFAVLMLSTLTAAVVAALAYIPWWGPAIPAALTLLYLYACARRVHRESDAYWERAAPAARPATRVDTAYGSLKRDRSARAESGQRAATGAAASGAVGTEAASAMNPDDEPTVIIEQADRPQVAVTVETSDGDVLWDPVPVTLPTYVSKPRARRTIRTIDLHQPGTWTSGNTEEASALVEQAAEAGAAEEAGGEDRRAVGS